MARDRFRTFATTADGTVVELTNVWHDGHVKTTADHFFGTAPDGTKMQADRRIDFKKNPSLHKCDARCETAKGHKCECSCGGKNHGIAA